MRDVIDILANMWRTEPAFHAVWAAIQNTAELRESQEHYNDRFVNDTLATFLILVMPQASEDERRLVGSVLFETSQNLLDFSVLAGEDQNAQVIEELKTLVISYLSAHETA